MRARALPLYALSSALVLLAAPALADFRLDRKLALAPGGTFSLQTDSGSVTVVGDSPSGVVVTITSTRDNLDRRMYFQFEEQPGAVQVTGRQRKWRFSHWFDEWFSGARVRFTVHVPRETAVAVYTAGGAIRLSSVLGAARVRTSGGPIQADNLTGDLDARTSGGPIRVERVAGDVNVSTSGGAIDIVAVNGRVQAETSGGPITIDASGGDVMAHTSGGPIRVRRAGGRVDARTSGGPITVDFAAGNNRGGMLSTSGGGVIAAVDPGAVLSIDASSSGGGVSSDLALTVRGGFSRNAIRGDLNGGGSTLRLRTSGGPIRISAAG